MGPHSQTEMRIERWLYGEGMTLESGSWEQKDSMEIQMMALYLYWPVILFFLGSLNKCMEVAME